jgi:maltose O-acetyltransferase
MRDHPAMLLDVLDRAIGWYHARRWERTAGRLGHLGTGVAIAQPIHLSTPEQASIGDFTYIGPDAQLACDGGLTIGRGVMIGPQVFVQTSTHRWEGPDLEAVPYDHHITRGPVTIGDHAWLGARVLVLPGVTIGEGAVVGAGSVVVADVEPCAVVAGNPARSIRHRDREQFERLRGRTHFELGKDPVWD